MDVYFGCGCFWHVQHEFVDLEETELNRHDASITARAAYAGGSSTGQGGKVCYHNTEDVADYGELGHAEVVSLSIPKDKFNVFADKFWSLCPQGERQDPQDVGPEYRSVVGLPGGMSSELVSQLQDNLYAAELLKGKGDDDDTLSTTSVYVYDTAAYPATVAEKYHQFHDDMIETYTSAYHDLNDFASQTDCPGDDSLHSVHAPWR